MGSDTVRLQFEKIHSIKSQNELAQLWDTTLFQVFNCIHQYVNDFKIAF